MHAVFEGAVVVSVIFMRSIFFANIFVIKIFGGLILVAAVFAGALSVTSVFRKGNFPVYNFHVSSIRQCSFCECSGRVCRVHRSSFRISIFVGSFCGCNF